MLPSNAQHKKIFVFAKKITEQKTLIYLKCQKFMLLNMFKVGIFMS